MAREQSGGAKPCEICGGDHLTEEHASSNYFGTAKSELDHYFGNVIGALLINLQVRKEQGAQAIPDEELHSNLDEFIASMRTLIEKINSGTITATEEVNANMIQELITLARSIDPTREDEVTKLRERYQQIEASYK